MNQITAIIVDDHAAFRRTLRKFVQTIGDIEVVGEAADGQAGLELTIKLRPQLVLMDICMPQLNGRDSCRAMKRDHAALRVVLYSAAPLETTVAIAQGAADLCLNKESLFEELPGWIGETFTSSQPTTCLNRWPNLSHCYDSISDCLAMEINYGWLGRELGAAIH